MWYLFDIHGGERGKYVGRSSGFKRKKVSLDHMVKSKWFANSTVQLRSWRSLVALQGKAECCADDLASSELWQSVRRSLLQLDQNALGPKFLCLAPSLPAMIDNIERSDGCDLGFLGPTAKSTHDHLVKDHNNKRWAKWTLWAQKIC